METGNCAYLLTHVPSGKFYVGSTGNIKRRMKEHFGDLKKGNHHCKELQELYNAAPVVKVTMLYIADTRDDAFDLEQQLLDIHAAGSLLLNKAKNARKAWLGLNHSPETKSKISNSQLGVKNHSFGRTLSEEHRSKISKANRGYKHTAAARAKITASKLGKSLSEEHKTKLSDAKIGTTHTVESREKMSRSKKGRVLTLEHRIKLKVANSNRKSFLPVRVSVAGVIYPTIAEAARDLGITVIMLRRRLDSTHPKHSMFFRVV